jgi:hypothetical protein
MSTVILVGAGATLAEALPSRPPKDKRPPLDRTFFELCHAASLAGRQQVQDYMWAHFGINPLTDGRRMEEIFNFIYTDAFSTPLPSDCLDAYSALIRMYIQAIARTTNSLDGHSRYGVGALLRHLWDRDKSSAPTILTFNQDLLIEKAIETTVAMSKYASLPWSIQHAYGIPFTGFSGVVRNPKPFKRAGDSSVQVLKLHGSANWHYSVRSNADPKNSIRNPHGKLRCINDQGVWARVTFKGARRRYSPSRWWCRLSTRRAPATARSWARFGPRLPRP